MEVGDNRLGARLVRSGYLTPEALEEAERLHRREGGLFGQFLVRHGFLTQADLDQFFHAGSTFRLGEVLLSEGLITADQLNRALDEQRERGGRIGGILVSLGYISDLQIEAVVQRNRKEPSRLGELLIRDGYLNQEDLDRALDMQKKSGGRLGDILAYYGYVSEDVLNREIATQRRQGRIGAPMDPVDLTILPYEMAERLQAVVTRDYGDSYQVASPNVLAHEDIEEIEEFLGDPVELVFVSENELLSLFNESYRSETKHESVFKLYDKHPMQSAIVTLTKPQSIAFAVLAIVIVIGFIINWFWTFIVLITIGQIVYATLAAFKLISIMKAQYSDDQVRFSQMDVNAIDERDLPIYTILVPVYREAGVIADLMQAIQNIDYPQHKLDVRILLEEDDTETILAVQNMDLPSTFVPLIVPSSQPQTKPKACNFGLLGARGEYVVIYDAEDRPDPDQLKKVFLAFQTLPKEYVCIQGKLNYFNCGQNMLTRLFTTEYSVWFESLLVGLMQMGIPLPLGGTSNHFKTSFLKEVGGWDPFNVTEDADLGIRLYRNRYKTAVIDSRTWEEANSRVGNWVRQRSRWLKGYLQTWLVHMRNPRRTFRQFGLRGFIGYQCQVLGTPLLPLMNPIFWTLMVLWILFQPWWVEAAFPGIVYYMSVVLLLFGNFVFTYTNMTGMYDVIRDCAVKRSQPFSFSLVKYGLLSPVYWILMSVAAYKGLWQLLRNPFYWEKTEHGLTDKSKENKVVTDEMAGDAA
ncbi:glycosyltransferase [Collinsella tanakaei]|nr:glycosyltransferase [Collinsella tanakaei]